MAPIDRIGTDGRAVPPLEAGTWWYAAVAAEAPGSFNGRVRKRLRNAALGAVLTLAVVYAGLVLTATGQRWEGAATAGRLTDGPLSAARVVGTVPHHFALYSLSLALLLIAVVGVLRRRYAPTVAALGSVIGSVVLAELLQRFVLHRPDLTGAPGHLLHGGFPSGHTTLALSVTFALALVVPYRLRVLVVAVGALWATFLGVYTLAIGWHRPGDLIGAELLALALVCGTVALLARKGRARRAPRGRAPFRNLVLATPLVLGALAGLGAGLVLLSRSMGVRLPADPVTARLAYEAGQLLAAGAGLAAALLFLALLRHVDLDESAAPPRRIPAGPEPDAEITGPFTAERDHEIS
ncbi:phosphatase PAP2 family protein [Streptomyces sp. NPDC053755]|uniref:phosphatase PAP2 family protein n=1 Tax=Streptomyces sp. NPDC053755 TaxID=3155815 RepID=UPI00342B792D